MKRMVWALALGLAACGGGGGAGDVSCDINNSGGHTCFEYAGTQSGSQWQQECTTIGGVSAESGCSHTDAVGGCKVDNGGASVTTWYYAPYTVDLVEQDCSGGSFVSP